MTAAIFFDFTPYRLKAANASRFFKCGTARDWWNSDKARAKDTGAPWWLPRQPAAKDAETPPANKGFFDWLFK